LFGLVDLCVVGGVGVVDVVYVFLYVVEIVEGVVFFVDDYDVVDLLY